MVVVGGFFVVVFVVLVVVVVVGVVVGLVVGVVVVLVAVLYVVLVVVVFDVVVVGVVVVLVVLLVVLLLEAPFALPFRTLRTLRTLRTGLAADVLQKALVLLQAFLDLLLDIVLLGFVLLHILLFANLLDGFVPPAVLVEAPHSSALVPEPLLFSTLQDLPSALSFSFLFFSALLHGCPPSSALQDLPSALSSSVPFFSAPPH